MKRIGFFGGCFNPVTNIHIKIANNLIKEGKLDKVIFVPVNDYYKKENLASARDRFNMLELATKKYDNLEVDDIEIKEDRPLYAVDAFEVIMENSKWTKSCKKDIYLIMGSDNFKKMPKWKDYDKIKDKYNYIVIDRDEKEFSSTIIREMLKNNDKKVLQYLPKEVYEYIDRNKLYKL